MAAGKQTRLAEAERLLDEASGAIPPGPLWEAVCAFLEGKRPQRLVYCLVCVTPDDAEADTTHIFSTAAKRNEFMERDSRDTYVAYDYVLDEPEAYEGRRQ